MKDKNKLMNCFLIISLFIFIYIILVLCNIDRITDYNFWSEGSSPSAEVSKSIIIYIYPSLFIYIASCIFFMIKKTNPRKVMYPIAIIVLAVFGNIIGVIKSGGAFIWSIFFTFLPTIWIIVMSIGLGMKIDKKYEKKKNIVGE